jgi:Uncharacterized protein conserved in bacteria (DUF2213)
MNYRTEILEGRPHLVVPVVMGVVGVWDGSRGPLMYTADDLRSSVPLWNGKPVCVFHPSMETDYSAGHPQVFNRQRVGTVFNARFDSSAKALKAEAWLDPDRLRRVDPAVLSAVQAGRVMEVSTGLFTENESAQGNYKGSQYIAIARNHRPDHLAILPEGTGACSIAQGAGLCRNRVRYQEPPLLMPSMVA